MDELEDGERRRWRFRFTSGSLFLITLIVAILAGAANYLMRSMQGDDAWLMVFLTVVLVTPIGLAVFLSILMQLIRWIKSPPR